MRSSTSIAAVLLVPLFAYSAEEGFHKYEYPGYDNTPLIPGSEFKVHQKGRAQPPRVVPAGQPGEAPSPAPSDAIVLFDGKTLDLFQKTSWQVKDASLIAGKGNLVTKSAFGDCQLHVEWRAPTPPTGKPSNMGNSGVFLMGLYELQIYDSFSSKIYPDGSAAAIYGQTPPMANACRPPGQWQTYGIVFRAPVFREKKLVKPARITVLHNGVLVHDNTEILGPTTHRNTRPYRPHAPKLPLMIQGHSSPVEFRSVWIRELATGQ